MGNPLCLYHQDKDGFGAAYAIWRAHGNRPEYRAVDYGDPPPTDVQGREVWIVDFSYKADQLDQIAQSATQVLVIDHHASSQEELSKITASNVEVFHDVNHSGAVLTWQRFNPRQKLPYLLALVEDRDLYRFQLDATQPMSLLLGSYPYEFATWDWIQNNIDTAIREAQAIQRFYDQKLDELEQNAYTAPLVGYSIYVCNAPGQFASDLGNRLAETSKFVCVYQYDGRLWTYQLRTRDPDVDVSEIAKLYGGGGHRKAAGFRKEKLLF